MTERTSLKQCSEKLQLQPVASEILTIHKLRQETKPETVVSPVVELDLKLQSGQNFRIRANVLSSVVKSVPHYPVNQKLLRKCVSDFSHLAIQAPKSLEWLEIDMLIGLDYYNYLVQGISGQLGSTGLFIRESRLGKLISGTVDGFGETMQSVKFLQYRV